MTIKKVASACVLGFVGTIQALAGGQYPDRWFYCGERLENDKDYAKYVELIDRAAAADLNGMLFTRGLHHYGTWSKRQKELFQKVVQHCEEKDVEIIPLVWSAGYGSFSGRDPHFAETVPVTGVLHCRQGDKLVLEPSGAVLKNADFENVDKARNRVSGWFTDVPGTVSFVDDTVAHSGKTSVRIVQKKGVNKHGHARMWQEVKVLPHRKYKFSIWTRKEGFDPRDGGQRLQVYLKGQDINSGPTTGTDLRDPTGGGKWFQASCTFMSGEADAATIWVGMWGGPDGTVWWDDAKLEELPLTEVVRTEDVPFTVKDAKSGVVYQEGKDYLLKDGVKTELTVPAGSAIPEGGTVLIDAWVVAHCGPKGQRTDCPANPKLIEAYRASIKEMMGALKIKKLFLDMDEFRNGGTCPRCLKRDTDMAHLFGELVTEQVKVIHEADPSITVYMWNDMVDPNHNAKEKFWGCRGSFVGSWKYIPKDIVICIWGANEKKVKFFEEQGFRQMIAGYYDAKNLDRDKVYIDLLNKVPNATGLMYTTWDHRYELLDDFGKLLKERSDRQ